MQVTGKYGEILRALGRVADEEEVAAFDITESDMFITIAWRTPEGIMRRRSYGEAGITDLHRDARLARATARGKTPIGFRESLRVIGQDLDRDALFLSSVSARSSVPPSNSSSSAEPGLQGGITIATVTDDQQMSVHWYSTDELAEKSRRRRGQRGSEGPPKTWWRRLFKAKVG